MTAYLITYDNHPPRDYHGVYELMDAWDAVRLAESVWLADLQASAVPVREAVKAALQPGDTVAVLELAPGADWAIYASAASAAWLKAHVAA